MTVSSASRTMSILLRMRSCMVSAMTRYPMRCATEPNPHEFDLAGDSMAMIVPNGRSLARSRERAAMTSGFVHAPEAVTIGLLSVCSGTALYAVSFTVRVFSGTEMAAGTATGVVVAAMPRPDQTKKPVRAIETMSVIKQGKRALRRAMVTLFGLHVNG